MYQISYQTRIGDEWKTAPHPVKIDRQTADAALYHFHWLWIQCFGDTAHYRIEDIKHVSEVAQV